MEFRNRETGALVNEQEFRRAFPNTSFPDVLSPETIDHFGYDPVLEGPQPTLQPFQTAVRDGVELIRGQWFTKYTAVDPDPETLAQLQADAIRNACNWKGFWDGLLVNAAFVHVQQVATQNLAVNLAYTNCSAQLLLARQGDLNIDALQACFNQLLGLLVGDIALEQDEKNSLVELAAATKVNGLLTLDFSK